MRVVLYSRGWAVVDEEGSVILFRDTYLELHVAAREIWKAIQSDRTDVMGVESLHAKIDQDDEVDIYAR